MESIRSFMNLKSCNDKIEIEHIENLSDVSSDEINERIKSAENYISGEESVFYNMLQEIREKTKEILEKEKQTTNVFRLSEEDIQKIKSEIKTENQKQNQFEHEKQDFKKIFKYTLLAINTVMITIGVGFYLYNRKSSKEQTKEMLNCLENYTFKTKSLGGDSFLFKSHPRGSDTFKFYFKK